MSLLALLVLAPPKSLVAALTEHVSFLASDALMGRATTTRGLDAAAEYIAARFRGAGVAPGVGASYFQTTTFGEQTVRNVIAVVKGRDPNRKDQFVLVSAHYDHLGTNSQNTEDRIYNGANDDASGVAAIIEIARMVAAKPAKRTVVFLATWGEERGLYGSKYYARNPVFPIKDTIANVNLEQLGRTDDSSQGDRKLTADITGARFSNASGILAGAFKDKGLTLNLQSPFNEPYFVASDNYSLALAGVPAHTVSVAYEFPDYHQPSDEWQKLDYPNMASITLGLEEGVRRLADIPVPPKWAEIPETKRFRDAQNGG